ncbi:MAG: hypothetical protein U0U46_18335 [Saprospiraceae bacterium]|nr:hypothetical protein [Saprospiraceae bacterium]
MIRRSFLQTGALGLLGLSLPSGVSAAIFQPAPNATNWFGQLVSLVGACRRTPFLMHPRALRNQIHQTNTLLAATGFNSRDSSLFFYPDQTDFCFYPLLLHRASAGLVDLLMPVLGQNADGSWRQIAVLTSYQMEALVRASAALAAYDAPMAEFLLPAGPLAGASIPTKRGRVEIETCLENGTAITRISVEERGNVIFSDKFVSEHCLSHTPNPASLQA